ncbi:MAG: sigma-E factor negative regulatory protein [Rhodoferax sp.]
MNELTPLSGERLSALVDGGLQGDDCAQALASLLSEPQSVHTWHAYHVVGDVLRSGELAPTTDDFAFWAKLERQLAQQPQRPRAVDEALGSLAQDGGRDVVFKTPTDGANAPVFRWKLVAGLACTALVGVVGLNLWGQMAPSGAAQLAVAPVPSVAIPQVVVADTSVGVMLRDPELDALMAAHQQLGGHSALQVPAGFLRNATYEGPAR